MSLNDSLPTWSEPGVVVLRAKELARLARPLAMTRWTRSLLPVHSWISSAANVDGRGPSLGPAAAAIRYARPGPFLTRISVSYASSWCFSVGDSLQTCRMWPQGRSACSNEAAAPGIDGG